MKKLTSSPRIISALDKMKIQTSIDVLYHLPRKYENFAPTKLTNLKDKDRVVLVGHKVGRVSYNKTGRLVVVRFQLHTTAGYVFRVVAFNRPYLTNFLNDYDIYTIIGKYNAARREINLETIIKGESDESEYLRPIYSLPKALKNFEYVGLVKRSLTRNKGKIKNNLPGDINEKYRFISEEEALNKIHFPVKNQDVYQGLRVLKYQESLIYALQTQLIRKDNKALVKDKKAPIELKKVNDFVLSLSYKLTSSQVSAVREIILDMNEETLMYRLLQGDVGSGKTVVAAAALYANYLRGDQGAFLAPTDALARQHYETFKTLFSQFPLRIALLVGSLSESEKTDIKKQLQEGKINLIIGTHALFSKDVFYSSLGLIVIDEQHRFGVSQRATLAAKGDHADILLISATPIPRTLAMSVYGEMDVTTLDQFPNEKRDVTTQIVTSENPLINKAIAQTLRKKEQIFIIAPRIEEVEDKKLSAEQLFKMYVKTYPGQVSLLHGKLSQEEKEAAFKAFNSGSRPILVATSVIEVGIDVPGASLMLIYAPTHFGLASLHQLRGRIGRKGQAALCLLIGDDFDENDLEKLNVLVKSNDGFYIAEQDLAMRGPGEITGSSQSGLPDFRYVNLIQDFEMFKYAKEDAINLLEKADNPLYRPIIAEAKGKLALKESTDI